MDVTGEGQRDRPALRVHRLSVVVCVLGFTIGPASGRLRARIARWGAAWALIWQLERTRASMIASSPARCPEVETTMGTHPFLLLCPTGQNEAHAGACQVAGPAKTDKEHLRTTRRRGTGSRWTPVVWVPFRPSLRMAQSGRTSANGRGSLAQSAKPRAVVASSEIRSLEFVW